MRTQSADTNPIIEDKLINIIKENSVQKRLSLLFHLSSLTRRLSYRALIRKNPKMSKQELDLLFIKLNYGEILHDKVKQYYSR